MIPLLLQQSRDTICVTLTRGVFFGIVLRNATRPHLLLLLFRPGLFLSRKRLVTVFFFLCYVRMRIVRKKKRRSARVRDAKAAAAVRRA